MSYLPDQLPIESPTTDMPVIVLTARSKYKMQAEAQDENGAAAHIPVQSSSASGPTASAVGASRSPSINGQPSTSLSRKASIVFPKSSRPAPPVVTPSHAATDHPSQGKQWPRLGRRLHPRITAKEAKNGPPPPVLGPSLWTTLLTRDKGVIAQTLDRNLLQGEGTLFSATMITPKMLQDGLKTDETAFHAWKAAKRAIEERPNGVWNLNKMLSAAMDHYLVALGVELLQEVPGPHFTFIDPRNHYDGKAMVREALRLMRLFAAEGYRRDRIVITIPATEAGIQAAKKLEERHRVRTNLASVSGLMHAAICAEAGASFVMLPYTSLLDAFVHRNPGSTFMARVMEALNPSSKRLADDAIESTAEHFNAHGLKTRILLSLTGMPALNEAQRLQSFDGVVLDEIQSHQAKLSTPVTRPAPIHAPKDGTQAKAWARETHCLSSYFESTGDDFLAAMSAEARGIAHGTLERGLEDGKLQMKETTDHMLQHLKGEAQLAHLDGEALEELYQPDVFETDRILRLLHADITPQQLAPIRSDDVGYRMASASWDKPEE